jgi:hypothetical protein
MRSGLQRSTDRRVGIDRTRRSVFGRRASEDFADDCGSLFSSPTSVQPLGQFRPLLSFCQLSEQRRSLFVWSPVRRAWLQPAHHLARTAESLRIITDVGSKDFFDEHHLFDDIGAIHGFSIACGLLRLQNLPVKILTELWTLSAIALGTGSVSENAMPGVRTHGGRESCDWATWVYRLERGMSICISCPGASRRGGTGDCER